MEFKRVIEVTKETREFLQKAFNVTGAGFQGVPANGVVCTDFRREARTE